MVLTLFSTLLQSLPGHLMPTHGGLFPRDSKKTFPMASRGEGCWIIADDGRRFLDASGQAAVVSIGHGVPEIGRAMAEQSSQIAFAHTSQFHTAPAEKLAGRLLAMAPPNFHHGGRVYFTSGGSEATETAIKLARQFHIESGQKDRYRVVSRRQSYHGSTLGAMSVSGNVARRAPYAPLLAEWGHIAPCFCYHCPFEKTFPQCEIACADDLGNFLLGNNPESVSAFIFEPVVGATLGAAAPPEGYAVRIAEICRKHNILLIADEVMSGMGRTGIPFAVQTWRVEPDMILVGKGIASGYAPLGAVLISARVVEAFERGSGAFNTASRIRHILFPRQRVTRFSTTWNRTDYLIASSRWLWFFEPGWKLCNPIRTSATFADAVCFLAWNLSKTKLLASLSQKNKTSPRKFVRPAWKKGF